MRAIRSVRDILRKQVAKTAKTQFLSRKAGQKIQIKLDFRDQEIVI